MIVDDMLVFRWTVTDFITATGTRYPLLKRYADTPQDPQWHAEGNVHIHTDWVLKEMYALFDGPLKDIPARDKVTLLLAALFHDYAKPICTQSRDINGVERIVAPRHEEKGASLLWHCSPPPGVDEAQWQDVINLTAYHHIPKRLVLKDRPRGEYLRLSRQVPSLDLLYWLEVADMKGRACEDKQEQLDIMTLFRLTAQEYGCLYKTPDLALKEVITTTFDTTEPDFIRRVEETARIHMEEGKIFQAEEELAIAFGYRDSPTVTLMCGVAGAGKSTWIANEISGKDVVLIELDAIRETLSRSRADQRDNDAVLREGVAQLKQALREKRDVIWDATNLRKDFRSRIIGTAVNYGAYTRIVSFMLPESNLRDRNLARGGSGVSANVIEKMVTSFQRPEIGEAHELVVITP